MAYEFFEEPILVARLRGGLGNQLFEYAAARSIANRNRVPLLIDSISGFVGDPFGRRFELHPFALNACVIPEGAIGSPAAAARILREYLRIREYIAMRYLGRNYDPVIHALRVRHPMVFDAYCQSYKYFTDIEGDLRNELDFRSIPEGIDHSLESEIRISNSVCVHARRQYGRLADGSSSEAIASYYGACGFDYYRNSLLELKNNHGPLKIFIFSDDLAWACKNIQAFAIEGCEVEVVPEIDTMRSFYLMRLCRHFVIANSTFSWWAAWLGNYPVKAVYAPSVWSSGQRKFPKDLIPENWRIAEST